MSSPEDIEQQFYEALQQGDIERLMAVWADDDEIDLAVAREFAETVDVVGGNGDAGRDLGDAGVAGGAEQLGAEDGG